MDGQELLGYLRRRGFEVSADGGKIRVSPASKLSPAEQATIRHYKAALL